MSAPSPDQIDYSVSLLQNSAAGRLPRMATKGTKTQMVTFVLFVVRQHFSPSRTRYRKRQNLTFAGKVTPATNFAKSSSIKGFYRNRAPDSLEPDPTILSTCPVPIPKTRHKA